MIAFVEYLISGLLLLGGVFGIVGSYGLLKLKDPMQRLHAPTKATTIGVGTSLIASALYLMVIVEGPFTWHELLVAIFLFLTAPLSALFMAKVHIFRTVDPAQLPDTGTGTPWATLDQRPPQG